MKNIPKPKVKVEFSCSLDLVSSDQRRDVYEVNFSDDAFTSFLVKDGSRPLGQHFHKNKVEIFYFVEGSGIIRVAPVDENGVIVGNITSFNVQAGSIIRIPAYYTHRFDLCDGTRFVCYSSKPFDENAKDLNPCPI